MCVLFLIDNIIFYTYTATHVSSYVYHVLLRYRIILHRFKCIDGIHMTILIRRSFSLSHPPYMAAVTQRLDLAEKTYKPGSMRATLHI